MKCKQCGTESLNGTNFCKRSCRISWIREHSVKGAKKKYRTMFHTFMDTKEFVSFGQQQFPEVVSKAEYFWDSGMAAG